MEGIYRLSTHESTSVRILKSQEQSDRLSDNDYFRVGKSPVVNSSWSRLRVIKAQQQVKKEGVTSSLPDDGHRDSHLRISNRLHDISLFSDKHSLLKQEDNQLFNSPSLTSRYSPPSTSSNIQLYFDNNYLYRCSTSQTTSSQLSSPSKNYQYFSTSLLLASISSQVLPVLTLLWLIDSYSDKPLNSSPSNPLPRKQRTDTKPKGTPESCTNNTSILIKPVLLLHC